MKESKAARAFQRKLLIAWCIAHHPSNIRQLQKITGMPRRTLQDCIKDLDDIGIQCQFLQLDSQPNNQGVYRILDWGPIEPNWVDGKLDAICRSLNIELDLDDNG